MEIILFNLIEKALINKKLIRCAGTTHQTFPDKPVITGFTYTEDYFYLYSGIKELAMCHLEDVIEVE